MNSDILIEPIIDKKVHGFAIQAKTFDFDIKITNISNSPSIEFNISRVLLKSAQNLDFHEDFNKKTFNVKILNPEESIILRIGKFGHFMYGLVAIVIDAQLTDPLNSIQFLQKNPFTSEYQKITKFNYWVDFIFIKSLKERGQESANKLMIWLTTVITILTIFIAWPTMQQLIKTIFR